MKGTGREKKKTHRKQRNKSGMDIMTKNEKNIKKEHMVDSDKYS